MHTDLLFIPMGARWREVRAAALAAEAAGFSGIWTWDHLRDSSGGGAPTLEAWTLLSALAGITNRVMLGPLVLNVINRPPGLLANMAATLQEASGGRLLLGLGAGGDAASPYAQEQRMLEVVVEADAVRRQRVEEAVAVLRALWQPRPVTLEQAHYPLRGAAGFLHPEPPPPVIIAGFGPKMASLAGTHGDGFNTQAAHPQLAALLATARTAHATAGGAPDQFIATVFAGLAERWLRPNSPARQGLETLGVQRLILLVEPPFDPKQIKAAGRLLAGG